jgi:hypothetical protein
MLAFNKQLSRQLVLCQTNAAMLQRVRCAAFSSALRVRSVAPGASQAATSPATVPAGSGAPALVTATPAAVKVEPPAKSDWYYLGMGALGIVAVALPLIFLSLIQDDRDVREFAREHAPLVVSLLGHVLEVPSDVRPAADRVVTPATVLVRVRSASPLVPAIELPASDSVGSAVAKATGDAAAASIQDPVSAVLALVAAGVATEAGGQLAEAGVAPMAPAQRAAGATALQLLAQISAMPASIALPLAGTGALVGAERLRAAAEAARADASVIAHGWLAPQPSAAVDALSVAAAAPAQCDRALASQRCVSGLQQAVGDFSTRPVFAFRSDLSDRASMGSGWGWGAWFGAPAPSARSMPPAKSAASAGAAAPPPAPPRHRLLMGELTASAVRSRLSRIRDRLAARRIEGTDIPALEQEIRVKRLAAANAASAEATGPIAIRKSSAAPSGFMPRPLGPSTALPSAAADAVDAAAAAVGSDTAVASASADGSVAVAQDAAPR